MLGKGTVLHQHDIHVHHNRLEKVSGDAGAVDLECRNVGQALGGFESNKRSDSLVRASEELTPVPPSRPEESS